MRTFTLDTNCLIAVAESRPEAADVLRLSTAHASGTESAALVAISASERQQSGEALESFDKFKARIASLGLGHLELLKPLAYWDITFWDFSLWSDDTMVQTERKIHEILFPNIEFLWPDFCAARGLAPETTPPDRKWRNAKCDVLAYWSHVHAGRAVFVTSDRNFHTTAKAADLQAAFGGSVLTPQSAASLLS